MSKNTVRKLKTAAAIMAVTLPISMTWEFVDSGRLSLIGVFVGALLPLPLVVLEGSSLDTWIRRLPFSHFLLARALAYTFGLFVVFQAWVGALGIIRGRPAGDPIFFPLNHPELWVKIAVGFVMYGAIALVRQLNRLLGPGVFLSYLKGRYHTPRRETRIFMFLDLKSSTTLAEELGPEQYYALVNEFFRDISEPVLNSNGEIYEYVGDEAVITWEQERGLLNANCLKIFFELDAIIERKTQWYLDQFGVVPEYKAGIHLGEVITAEIGDLKRGLVFNGDVLNTGARIQGECGRLGRRLVASAPLVERLDLPVGLIPEAMGPVTLRGKAEPMELVAFA